MFSSYTESSSTLLVTIRTQLVSQHRIVATTPNVPQMWEYFIAQKDNDKKPNNDGVAPQGSYSGKTKRKQATKSGSNDMHLWLRLSSWLAVKHQAVHPLFPIWCRASSFAICSYNVSSGYFYFGVESFGCKFGLSFMGKSCHRISLLSGKYFKLITVVDGL